MSLWKFGDFEAEIDFTDADFMDNIAEAKRKMVEKQKEVPKTGTAGDIIRAQIATFDVFYDTLFGAGAGISVRSGRNSVNVCVEATDSLLRFEKDAGKEFEQKYDKYNVQNHGNRQQRRNYNKGNNKNRGRS